eukprot:12916468-Prorocentrum_lima.AAC.1
MLLHLQWGVWGGERRALASLDALAVLSSSDLILTSPSMIMMKHATLSRFLGFLKTGTDNPSSSVFLSKPYQETA